MTLITVEVGLKSIRIRDGTIVPMSMILPGFSTVSECLPKGEIIVLKHWEALSMLRQRCGIYSLEEAVASIRWLRQIESGATLFIPDYTLTLYYDVTGWVLWGYRYYGPPPDVPESYFPPNVRVMQKL